MIELALAIILPWGAGVSLYSWLSYKKDNISYMELYGYGFLLGQLVLWLIFLGLDKINVKLSFYLVAFFLFFIALGRRNFFISRNKAFGVQNKKELELDALFICLLILLLIRGAVLFFECIFQPIIAWDAMMNWAPRAKIWFYEQNLEPIVSFNDWIKAPEMLRTSYAWHYPPGVPFSQMWIAMALQRWDEYLINLPWFFLWVSMGMVLYSQLCQLKINPIFSLLATYMLLSMPIVNMHVALAGYADLWVAAALLLSTLSALCWLEDKKSYEQLGIILILCVALLFLKVPGLIWAVTIIGCLVIFALPKRVLLMLLCISGLAVLIWYGVGGFVGKLPVLGDVVVTPERLRINLFNFDSSDFKYNHKVWSALYMHLYDFISWNGLFYYMPIAMVVIVYRFYWDPIAQFVLSLTVFCILELGLVFFFSPRSDWIIDGTTTNRAILHVVPIFIILIALSFRKSVGVQLLARDHSPHSEKNDL